MPKELTPSIVKEWLDLIDSTPFDVREIWAELGIISPQGKNHLRVILYRFEHQTPSVVVNLGNSKYRKIDHNAPIMDLENADPTKIVPLLFPFGEHEFVTIYPRSIIIVAGSKQAGKTEYLYNFLKLNMGQFPIDLFNSETGEEQMKMRFISLGIPIPPPFNPCWRFDNFADVIEPDRISVIDYLDVNSEVYLVGAEIDRIFRKLRQGVAIIGLQKPPPSVVFTKGGQKKIIERDLAYGGGFTAKRAVLYITMGQNKLKLLHVKTPKQPKINPQNMIFNFKFDDDGHFCNIARSYGDEEGELF
ncbi:MAG: hypothetical protein ABH870_01730 [bacterium]